MGTTCSLPMFHSAFLKNQLSEQWLISRDLSMFIANIIAKFLPIEFAGAYNWNGDKPEYDYWDNHSIKLLDNYTYTWKYRMRDKYPGDTEVEEWDWVGIWQFGDTSNSLIFHVKDQTIFANEPIEQCLIQTQLIKTYGGYCIKL